MSKCNEILEAIAKANKCIYDITNIFVGNLLDIAEIDMNQLPTNVYFIGYEFLDRGEIYMIKEGSFKRKLYEVIRNHPDKVFRGKKSILDFYRSEEE